MGNQPDQWHDEAQGNHRTGTKVDQVSADWLASEVRKSGLTPAREAFKLSRVDPISASLSVDGHRTEGVPLFDGGFTDSAGITGPLDLLGSEAPGGLAEGAPNTSGTGPLGEAHRQNRHRAIIMVTRGGLPCRCPSNAHSFLRPFGPPVLQVSSDEAGVVHRARGRCQSVVGDNALFHNQADRGPEAVDPNVIAQFVAVFTPIAKTLAGA